ncbi:MAG TPA: DUF3488 and transglutaminase-like domain-containing protein [Pyrinomonadaceae bacterium]|nr:DUF3488 and transglutaminase-like domain-containing protein [Pyrinomonadaceae bacterium]
MTFDKFFRAASYVTVGCGALALLLAGGLGGWLAAGFAVALVVAWCLEGTKRQLSERAGLFVVLLALPVFYLDWNWQADAGGAKHAGVSALVHLTLFLSTVKLLQVKADRDWLFLYLISFFQVLLAAGLSISPVYVATLGLYLFSVLLTVVCFELRKAARVAPRSETRLLVAQDSARSRRLLARIRGRGGAAQTPRELRRLPVAAFCLLLLILALALPIFFITPRFGDMAMAAGGSSATGYVGFTDQVSLGDVGRLQKSDRLVMRVRVEEANAGRGRILRWRGVALDNFDGRTWRRSSNTSELWTANERGMFQLGTTEDLRRLTTQEFFVEPIDTPVLFAASRAVALQGALPYLRREKASGTLTTRPHTRERLVYRAYSDTVEPAPEVLRLDAGAYPREARPNFQPPVENYLWLPGTLDPRIAQLARSIEASSGARTRYDFARAVEAHLNRNEFGGAYRYSLEDLSGGADPLADFLFRARAGHCEFFSTAMAVMLRTQGIAARVVNGFQSGSFNDAADAYIVRQQDAHSWVEVYFPATDSWVTFDPTPVEGRPSSAQTAAAQSRWQKYAEALDLFWIQYVVAYDKQEQRTLANTLRGGLGSLGRSLASLTRDLGRMFSSAWNSLSGAGDADAARRGLSAYVPRLLAFGAALILLFFLVRRLRRRGFVAFARRKPRADADASASAVAFYERMLKALEARGLRRAAHQTPLEFALDTGVPEALQITQTYNSVRFGARRLSQTEAAEIEQTLRQMEGKDSDK